MMKKAFSLPEIDNAVQFNEPIGPEHDFFTDFSGVRGDFQDKFVYKHLNVNPNDFTFNIEANRGNKTLLFLAGLRGSGKTSELRKYAKKLHNPECFFCITCDIDQGLDMNNIEYMDILIFQLERLVNELKNAGVEFKEDILSSMYEWFSIRVKEINKKLSSDATLEAGVSSEVGLLKLIKIFASLKTGVKGSLDRSQAVRTNFKNNFSEFVDKFNLFIEEVNYALRKVKLAKEILFIVDGLEKVMSADMRKKIIIDESNRLGQIKVNTIFTLPVELMKETTKIDMFAKVISFPYVKLQERTGKKIESAYEKFEEFIFKRIDESLFESKETVHKIISYSGGGNLSIFDQRKFGEAQTFERTE